MLGLLILLNYVKRNTNIFSVMRQRNLTTLQFDKYNKSYLLKGSLVSLIVFREFNIMWAIL